MGSLEPGLGLMLVFVGVIIILVGILVIVLASTGGKGEVEGGAVVIIGPIPIVFGSNKTIATGLLLIAAAIFAFMIIMYLYAQRIFQ
ncbi:MAG: DUF131 domain-containing protein [Desulfurococcales archaeon]|nr:DUF131 domain-containing protein [Desulfurococcales archaeon]